MPHRVPAVRHTRVTGHVRTEREGPTITTDNAAHITPGAIAQYLIHAPHHIEPRDAVSTGYQLTHAWDREDSTELNVAAANLPFPQELAQALDEWARLTH